MSDRMRPLPPGTTQTFGRGVMGPILAGLLWDLLGHLQSSDRPAGAKVLFCSRGGLTLRRGLELLAGRIGVQLRLPVADLMISRLAAARVAIQQDPTTVARLVERELAGRDCHGAALALTGLHVDDNTRWNLPFTAARFVDLVSAKGPIRDALEDQADLLRRHVDQVRGTATDLIICDTGVFGSIPLYLQVGIPTVRWTAALLFRANYKRLPAPHFANTTGVACESDVYVPWRPRTAVLLYWQFLEAMLEPPLPTVRQYHVDTQGRVVSDLEFTGWQERLAPVPGSVLAGAWEHLGDLTPASVNVIPGRAAAAWKRLRRMIVFPCRHDVRLLAVGHRCLDFGIEETVPFTEVIDCPAAGFHSRRAAYRRSMWAEGELRKQFPYAATAVLPCWEAGRVIRGLFRAAMRFTR
jgi:hypothetical protein